MQDGFGKEELQGVCHFPYPQYLFKLYHYQVWSKLEGINESFVEVKMDECVVYVAMHAIGNNIEGNLYVKHNVNDTNLKVVKP